MPVFFVLLILFTAGIFLFNKYGLLGLFHGDLMSGIKPIAGGDSDFSKRFSDSKRINTLLLGTNQKLTDTIMLASFDTELKRVDLVSIPRDTYYERPNFQGAAYQKINSVYASEGVVALAQDVSDVLGGVPIHFYEIITDDGVAKIVDSMGGVEIDVPRRMKYNDPKQDLHIDLQKGVQVLDGAHAVQYLRYRKGYSNADLGRIEAQQEFMKEAFKQSIGLGFPKVARTVLREVESNMGGMMAARIGSRAIGMDGADITTYTIPGVPQTMHGSSYFMADRQKTLDMMVQIYSMKAEESN